MVYRNSWLVGIAAAILAFVTLDSLLKPTTQGLPWQVVVGGGLVLGLVISWTTSVYRVKTWATALIHLVLMAIVGLRIGAPETLRVILPTSGTGEGDGTFAVLGAHFDQAFDFIRNGVEPVIPVTGLVIILTWVFWATGAVMAWGLTTGRPFVALITPFVMTLQFATMDRGRTSLAIVVAFIVLAVLAILAVTRDQQTGSGRMYRRQTGAATRQGLAPTGGVLGVTVVATLTFVGLLNPLVPRDGLLEWRNPSGLTGEFTGSISYNPFIGIQQSLVNPTNQPVFFARIQGEVDPGEVYFRMVTMDTYSGSRFFADDPDVVPLEEETWEVDGNRFFGPSADVATTIQIAALSQDWLPATYAPRAVEGSPQLEANLRIRPDDASIHLDGGRTGEGLTYIVQSSVPVPDVAALASNEQGALSAAFRNARDEGGEELPASVTPDWREDPATAERYLEIPEDDLDNRLSSVRRLALEVTDNLETDFEKALALETWFHSKQTGDGSPTDGFTYTTDIQPGMGATDLAAWLLDEDSPNYHQGYCENFATAMGVMARTLGIPSRVVLGFTPGLSDPDDPSLVVVTDANAHAWVELWMPQQGWVRFDPTPRSAEDTPQTFEAIEASLGFSMSEYLDLPDPEIVAGGEIGSDPFLFEDDPFANPGILAPSGGGVEGGGGFTLPGWLPQLLWVVVAGAVLFGFLPLAKWAARRRRMRRLRTGDISAAWEEIVSRLADLRETPSPAATPREVAAGFDPVVMPLAQVYERSFYGPEGAIDQGHIETATVTLERTRELLGTRYSRAERLVALYRPGTVMPRRLRKALRRRR